jgi:hypothetical protein
MASGRGGRRSDQGRSRRVRRRQGVMTAWREAPGAAGAESGVW